MSEDSPQHGTDATEGRRRDIASVIARLEAATEGSRELDVLVIRAVFGYGPDKPLWSGLHYTTSVDAALTLFPSFRNRYLWCQVARHSNGRGRAAFFGSTEYVEAATPALALCIAALKARLATEGGAPEPVRGEGAEDGKSVMAEKLK